MPGNRKGGKKAAKTNRYKYGEEFYARIGAIGGKNGHTTGFSLNKENARLAGSKGGKRSKIGRTYLYTKNGFDYYQVTKPAPLSNSNVGDIEKHPTIT